MQQLPVTDYAAIKEGDTEHLLLDVRQPEEWEICHIEGARLVPLMTLPQAVADLAEWKDKPVYCLCHHGGRSAQAAQFLAAQGFENVTNLAGGIHVWAQQVDEDMPTY